MFSLRCSVIHPKRLIREIINGPSSFCCFEQWTKISVEYVEPFFRVLVLQFNRVSLMPNSVPKYLFGSKNLRLSCFFDKIRKNSDWFWSLRPTSPARDSCALIRLVLIQLSTSEVYWSGNKVWQMCIDIQMRYFNWVAPFRVWLFRTIQDGKIGFA